MLTPQFPPAAFTFFSRRLLVLQDPCFLYNPRGSSGSRVAAAKLSWHILKVLAIDEAKGKSKRPHCETQEVL